MTLRRLKLYENYDTNVKSTDFNSYSQLEKYASRLSKTFDTPEILAAADEKKKKKKKKKKLIASSQTKPETNKESSDTQSSADIKPEKKGFWS